MLIRLPLFLSSFSSFFIFSTFGINALTALSLASSFGLELLNDFSKN
jgi:hypothetical protein